MPQPDQPAETLKSFHKDASSEHSNLDGPFLFRSLTEEERKEFVNALDDEGRRLLADLEANPFQLK